MNKYTKVAAYLFGAMALVHTARVAYGWQAIIGGWEVPLWLSVLFLLVAGMMSWGLWKESR